MRLSSMNITAKALVLKPRGIEKLRMPCILA